MATAKLNVEGMSCGHCVQRVKNALDAIDGVGRVDVDLKEKKAEVDYDPQIVDMETIRMAIEDSGYTVV